ncbi:hypothetical protein VTJ49DRAFT_1758 [Mycothermus thermophilus]|uniref:Protein BNI4 n=1 Tax=Humicola insolens TaxID=85995 RepID=A0ABR3VQG7_HUMIN
MAALVQGYPQQTGTVTVLQTRPSSAGGVLQSTAQYMPGATNRTHGPSSTTAVPGQYRGFVQQQYALRSLPNLSSTSQWQQARTSRTSSTSALPSVQTLDYLQPALPAPARPRYQASVSMTNLPSSATMGVQTVPGARDDSALVALGARRSTASPRPSQSNNGSSSQSSAASTPTRPTPERYRRSALRSDSTGSSAASASSSPQLRPSPSAMQNRPNSFIGTPFGSAIDDATISSGQSQEGTKRGRRRSMPALESGFPIHLLARDPRLPTDSSRPKSADANIHRPTPEKEQPAPALNSGVFARPSSSASRNGSDPTASSTTPAAPEPANADPETLRVVNVPPRTSSTDATTNKRAANPSPLSKPVMMDREGVADQPASAEESGTPNAPVTQCLESPAVKQLTAISEKRGKAKNKTSRLRRAFSFGSAAELRKAVDEGDAEGSGTPKLHKDRNLKDAYDEEQARIAERQEAAGIGNSIYSGSRLFHGSTDNLSISSTASSASIMIRKMGHGMKKGTRSLARLFRPKASAASAPPVEPTVVEDAPEPTVSLVTAEAERERVNVNPDPKAQGGGTGFPHLERNSIDAAKMPTSEPERTGSSGTDSSAPRKTIVGGEKERAEASASVRKGILKNRNGSTPSPRPPENKTSAFDLPKVPSVTDSPNSSAPSTPNEDAQRRGGALAIGNEDYFVSALRLRQDAKSGSSTPQTVKRCATFSPRIVFFETWPSQEYDRRGEIATCNRLTPMLAQQIKEELNSFKMEMEVHENSKIYTHFF